MNAQGNGGPQSGGGQGQEQEPNNIGQFPPPPPPSLESIDLEEGAHPPEHFAIDLGEEAVEDGDGADAWGPRMAQTVGMAKKAGKWMMGERHLLVLLAIMAILAAQYHLFVVVFSGTAPK